MKSLFLPLFTLVVALGFLPLQAQDRTPQKQPRPLTAKEAAQKKLVDDAKDKVAKHPEDAEAHFELAKAYLRAEDVEAGLKAVDEAIQLKPDVAKYHAKRAMLLLFATDDLNESIKAWDEAMRLDPSNANYWFDRGEYRYMWGSWIDQEKEALADLEKVLALNPKHVTALAYVGTIQLEEKKYDLAKVSLQKALEIDQQNQPLANKFVNQGLLEPEDEVTWEERASLLMGARETVLAGLIQIFEVEGNKAERDAYLARIYSMNQGAVSDGDFCRDTFEMKDIPFKAHEAFVNDSPVKPKYRFDGFHKTGANENYRLIAIPLANAPGNPAVQPANAPPKYRYEFQWYRRGWVFTSTRTYKVFDKQPSYEEVKALLNEVLLGNLKHVPRNQSAVK